MTSDNSPQVLIVGAGPAGLVLALCLLKNGIPVRLIEKDAEHHCGERGAGIQPRTFELEHFLGVAKDVDQEGYGVENILIYDRENPTVVAKKMPFREKTKPTPAFPETRPILLGQWLHQAILRKHLEAHGGRVELGTRLVGLEQSDTDVRASLERASADLTKEEIACFKYVVGTDGARSFVRRAMGVEFIGETQTRNKIYLADVFMKGMVDEMGFYLWGTQDTESLMVRRCNKPDRFQLLFMGPEVDFDRFRQDDGKQDNLDKVQENVNRVTGRTDLNVTKVTWYGEWRPNLRIASTFRQGRLFIAGDAAHTHSPTGGQGLNTSIQDSVNLAWKIAYVLKGFSNDSVLESYSTERLPVVAEMLNMTTELHNKTYSGEVAREALASKDKADGLREDKPERNGWFDVKKLSQLDVNYRWSDIVHDERYSGEVAEMHAYGIEGRAARAGDRAPDAPDLACCFSKNGNDSITRLFDIFTMTKQTMLIFSDDLRTAEALLEAMSQFPEESFQTALIYPSGSETEAPTTHPIDFIFTDTKGHAYVGYGITSPSQVVIVRPDSWIGAVATGPEGVREYAKKVFNA